MLEVIKQWTKVIICLYRRLMPLKWTFLQVACEQWGDFQSNVQVKYCVFIYLNSQQPWKALWLDKQSQLISPHTEIVNHWGVDSEKKTGSCFHDFHCVWLNWPHKVRARDWTTRFTATFTKLWRLRQSYGAVESLDALTQMCNITITLFVINCVQSK